MQQQTAVKVESVWAWALARQQGNKEEAKTSWRRESNKFNQ